MLRLASSPPFPRLVALAVGAALLAAAAPARALEWAEGRVELHGFYETQVRGIARDWDASDDWDLAQWAHVLNLELEAEVAPLGWGPFDLVTGFARVEVRYDCVWTRACGIFPSANAYGDGAKRLPKRLADGRRTGFVGTLFTGDTRPWRDDPLEAFPVAFRDRPSESREAFSIAKTPAFNLNFRSPGPDQELGTADDPAPLVFARYFHEDKCDFSTRQVDGPTNGEGFQNLGPLDPQCFLTANAAAIDHPNPFHPADTSPVTGQPGSLALPYRPAPTLPANARAGKERPRGLWLPNRSLRKLLREEELEDPETNFRQDELAWNRGAAQQDEKELREAYLDIEIFDSRLWLRVGKQNIVWGKTELFRTTDQMNPQDLALSSLPTLEESRIPLWAVRGVWSFYEVGPLEDVRLELAANLDQHEPNDVGRCGEPYSPLLVCAGTFGFVAHSLEGLGLAGVEPPPDPWEDLRGLEAGARVEFRWKRFSFALTDFYGYSDLPHVERIFRYSRNVDPRSGRPRRGTASGECADRDGDGVPEGEACLRPGRDALLHHSANQTLFHKNCAATVGLVALDEQACGLAFFNSREPIGLLGITIGELLGGGLAGNGAASELLALGAGLSGGARLPLVALNQDPADGPLADGTLALLDNGRTLNNALTAEQQALLGCGPFYRTNCDAEGLDLMNAEASFLVQSFPTFDGTLFRWDPRNGRPQPGTEGFAGGPVATRYVDGELVVLPGARGPSDPGYDPRVDGCRAPSDHPDCAGASRLEIPASDVDGDGAPDFGPSTGQLFASEGAALSWNLAMVLIANSSPPDSDGDPTNGFDRPPRLDEFDPTAPFRSDGCSFVRAELCKNFASFLESVGTRRASVRAGGNGRFGRRDFMWHGGSPLVLRFEKRNVLGFAMDWAEDATKSSWSVEATWIEGVSRPDNDELDGLRSVDEYNLTVSVDRPTFVNFLNANRTFFLNTQWFVQYVDGHRKGFPGSGPWNLLVTATVTTGYFQDRLQPSLTAVYDKRSNSGALLPEIRYRWTENFSGTFGAALFAGRFEEKPAPIAPPNLENRVGEDRNSSFVENGLAPLRDRDELFLRVRYTF